MDTVSSASGEALLRAWLSLTANICNRRMVSGLTFNEAVVCNHLLHQDTAAPEAPLTATALCEKTSLLKSQMNQVLSSLERQGYLMRRRSHTDRRQVELHLTPAGVCAYQEAHRDASWLLTQLVEQVGADHIHTLTLQLEEVSSAIQAIRQKGTSCQSES